MTRIESLDAWLLVQEGWWHYRRGTRESNAMALQLYHRALAIDPDSSDLNATLGWPYHREGRFKWADDPEEAWQKAEYYAQKSIELNEENPEGYAVLGVIRQAEGSHTKAIELGKKAIELAPSDAGYLALLGLHYQKNMEAEKSITFLKRALRINPHVFGMGERKLR